MSQKRKERNMTQKELAAKLFVTESAVSKWERGVSYPDISIISAICEELQITEHELISAGEDYRAREIEKQAKGFTKIIKTYSWIFYCGYGISLLICLITNLYLNHCLSWFFIVFAAEMTAFSFLNLPVICKQKKGLATILGSYASIGALLAVCCIYTGGNWFLVVFLSLTTGYFIVFLPYVLSSLLRPIGIGNHKAFLCVAFDSVLIYLTVGFACWWSGGGTITHILDTVLPLVTLGITLPWGILLIARYLPCNKYYKAAIISTWIGCYEFVVNSMINKIIDKQGFVLERMNLAKWSEPYISGNITLIIFICLLILGVAFAIGGIAEHQKTLD